MKKQLLFLLLILISFNFTYSQIFANPPSFYTICELNTDGFAEFDLESKTSEVIGSQNPVDIAVTYHETINDALAGINALVSPYTNIIQNQQIFVRATDVSNSNIFDTTDFYINTGEIPTVGDAIANEVCDDNGDGIAIFNLSQNDAWFSGDPNNYYTSYYLTQADADSGINPIANPDAFINLSNPQTLYVRVEDPPTLCHDFSTLTLSVLPAPTPSQPSPIEVCDNDGAEDGFYSFDLTIYEAQIINGEANTLVSYHETQAGAESATNLITNPFNYFNTIAYQQTIYVRVESFITGCFTIVDFDLNVSQIPIANVPNDLLVCDSGVNGFADFDLQVQDAQILGTQDPASFFVNYYETEVDALSQTNPLASPYTNTSNPQIIFATINSINNNCVSNVVPFQLIVNTLDIFPMAFDMEACGDGQGFGVFDLTQNESVILNGSTDLSVTYYETLQDADGSTNPIPNPQSYTNTMTFNQTIYIRVEDLNTGCTFVSPNMVLFLTVQDLILEANSNNIENDCSINGSGLVALNAIGGDGSYEYSIDGSAYQTSNIFSGLSAGTYTFSAISALSCNTATLTITIEAPTEILALDFSNVIDDCDANASGEVTLVASGGIAPYQYGVFNDNFQDSNVFSGLAAGTYYFNVRDSLNCIQSIDVFVAEGTSIIQPTPLVAIDDDGDGFTAFNLDDKVAEIAGGIPSLIITFHETQADAINDVNALVSPYNNVVANFQTVYVRVENANGGCTSYVTLDLITEYVPFQVNSATLELCESSPNGIEVFDLTSANQDILGGLNPSDFSISYYNSQADANSQTNAITNPTAYNNISNPQIVFAGVTETATGNYIITTIDLIVNNLPIVDFDGNLSVCGGQSIVLNPNTGDPNFTYQWSTGETTPEIVVNIGGTYSVTVINSTTGCTNTGSVAVAEDQAPAIATPQDLVSCGTNSVFDLTTTVTEIANGIDPNLLTIAFYETQADADSGTNQIQNPNVYTAFTNPQSIFVAVYNTSQTICGAFVSFNLIGESCPTTVTCGTPVNNSYCYDNSETTQYTYTSNDGSPLQVIFNSGQVENNFDELVILDSDGVTNLNTTTPYGNGGDISNLNFVSSGDTIIVSVESDASISCQSNGFNPLDFTVTCVDVNALPDCNTTLITPQDGATNVNENVVLTWSAPTGIVTGFKISIGTTPGGTDIANAIDLGNVLTYTPGALASLTDYYVTIVPYNANGDATGCSEQNFTTREIPSPPVGVACTSGSPTYIFTENFETDVPSGWTGTGFSGDNGNWHITLGDANSGETGPSSSFNGNSHLEYEASGNSSTIASVTSPDIDLTTADSGAELSFYLHAFGEDIGTLNVNVNNLSTGVTETVFSWAGQYQETALEPWLHVGVNLDAYVGSIISIELSYGATGTGFKGDLSIDYLRVQTCGSFCIAPSDITVTNITETTADVSWVSNGNETEWEYVVQPAGTGEPTGGWISTNTSTLTLTGLIGTTDYEIYVRSNCGVDGFSLWSLRDFTTLQQTNFAVDCAINQPVNNIFCYENNETLQYTYTSSDGSPLYIVFNSGMAENNFDELIVLDSDGVTNLNANNPYGNAGDLSGLTFNTTGDTVTIYIESDGSVTGCTNAPIDVDVFCGSNIGLIEVNAFLDENNDGIFNGNDSPFTNGFFTYEINDDGSINTVNTNTGSFIITNQDETNSYDISFAPNAGYENCFNIPTALFENITVLNGNTVTIDFPITVQMSCEDLAVYLVPFSSPRPGFNHWNDLIIENLGATTITSGTVTFINDPIVNYVDSTPIGAGLTVTPTATGATVDFINLLPGETRTVWFQLYTPPTVNLGELVTSSAVYTTASNDIVPENNVSVIVQEVIGSYDPNDITESHGRDILYDDFITTDEYLYYTIRFQNIGTAEAINVRIENTVDALLDMSTLQMLRSSHDYVMMQTGNQLTWTFDNINLPAQSQDDFGSNGYVYFKVKPTAGYNIGTMIPNTAEIYFDFNAPVVTNTFITEFVENALSVDEFNINAFTLYPNPAKETINIKLNNALSGNTSVEVIDIQGKSIISTTIENQVQESQLNVSNLEAGLYFVKLKNGTNELIRKLIVE